MDLDSVLGRDQRKMLPAGLYLRGLGGESLACEQEASPVPPSSPRQWGGGRVEGGRAKLVKQHPEHTACGEEGVQGVGGEAGGSRGPFGARTPPERKACRREGSREPPPSLWAGGRSWGSSAKRPPCPCAKQRVWCEMPTAWGPTPCGPRAQEAPRQPTPAFLRWFGLHTVSLVWGCLGRYPRE